MIINTALSPYETAKRNMWLIPLCISSSMFIASLMLGFICISLITEPFLRLVIILTLIGLQGFTVGIALRTNEFNDRYATYTRWQKNNAETGHVESPTLSNMIRNQLEKDGTVDAVKNKILMQTANPGCMRFYETTIPNGSFTAYLTDKCEVLIAVNGDIILNSTVDEAAKNILIGVYRGLGIIQAKSAAKYDPEKMKAFL
jgi:hypothetical protein